MFKKYWFFTFIVYSTVALAKPTHSALAVNSPKAKSQGLVIKSQNPVAGSKTLVAQSKNLILESQKSAIKSQRPATQSQNPATKAQNLNENVKTPKELLQHNPSKKSLKELQKNPDRLVFNKQSDVFLDLSSLKFKNLKLFKKLKRYFKKKPVSKKEIQKFLIKNSYYQYELIRDNNTYTIKNPVKSIFVFKGQSFFSEKEIRKFIKIDEYKTGAFFYDFVKQSIKKAYQDKGFLKVKIKKTVVKKKNKEWNFIRIEEGERIRILEMRVRGLLSKPSSYYEDYIKVNSPSLIQKGFYSKKGLETGYENLIKHLKSEGYLQSKIYSDRVFFKNNQASITVHLEEGPLTLIRDIQIQNARFVPVWEILSHIKSRAQSSLKVHVLKEDLERIERFYKTKGYLNMRITNLRDVVKYTPGERYASIVIQVEEGMQAFISKITIKGLRKAKESMIRKILKFKAGDILTLQKKQESLKALGALGLFSDVSINEQFKDTGELELIVNFKERKPRSVRGALGINTERGWTTRAYAEASHRNLFGYSRAFIVRGSGQVSWSHKPIFLEYEASARYKEVFFPGYGYQGDVSLTQAQNVFRFSPNNINFVKKNQISFFINKAISQDLKMRWNVLSFENRQEACTQQKTCPKNPQQIGSAGLNLVWDKRDNIFDPATGFISSLMLEWASPILGSSSNVSFIKTDIQNQLFKTIISKYTAGLTLSGGLIQALNDSQSLPVSKAFILGGQSSIRGYDGNIEGERIPRDSLAPIQRANDPLQIKKDKALINVISNMYALLNFNFKVPVFEGLKGIFFYDLGLVYLKGLGQKKWDLDWGHSVGLGFRYQTFLIPVGLDIAYKLQPKESQEVDYRFHFSIGW